jgi:hypothetical protein
VLAAVVTPFAVAQSGTTGAVARVTNDDDRYAFLARNTRAGDGGAAALACQSDTGSGREPCLNMVNKGNGLAAAFRTRGNTGFRLQTSGSGPATPFVLDSNATNRVDHLNADQVDGQSAEQIGRERYARVNIANGAPAIGRSNGTATENPVIRTTGGAPAGDFTITFAADVNNCVYQATSTENDTARLVSADLVDGNNRAVRVVTRALDATNTATDTEFNLTVSC